ncbi:hypothetical protein G9A89_014324 [Geosiphon pyriformis]|nr:hypothetical protein G9A89_014324 [Geosiphon pyriformis]
MERKETLSEKLKRKSEDPKSLKRAQTCILILLAIVTVLYVLSEIWIVVSEQPVVKVQRLLKKEIPMPNLHIEFNYRFNVSCQYKYLDGRDASSTTNQCTSYLRQPKEKGKTGKYNADMITYNFSTPDVKPLSYIFDEKLYGVQLSILIDDTEYNANNDLGMFVSAVDTEFDPRTLPDKTSKTIKKLDPNFYGSLDSANKQIIGPFAENFMFVSRHISRRINPKWVSYIGIPTIPFEITYITTKHEVTNTAYMEPPVNIVGGLYAGLFVGTYDWVVEINRETRMNDLLQTIGLIAAFLALLIGIMWCCFGKRPLCPWGCCQLCCCKRQTKKRLKGQFHKGVPLLEKSDGRAGIIERINNLENFMKLYLVNPDYIKNSKERAEDSQLLLGSENGAPNSSPSSSGQSTPGALFLPNAKKSQGERAKTLPSHVAVPISSDGTHEVQGNQQPTIYSKPTETMGALPPNEFAAGGIMDADVKSPNSAYEKLKKSKTEPISPTLGLPHSNTRSSNALPSSTPSIGIGKKIGLAAAGGAMAAISAIGLGGKRNSKPPTRDESSEKIPESSDTAPSLAALEKSEPLMSPNNDLNSSNNSKPTQFERPMRKPLPATISPSEITTKNVGAILAGSAFLVDKNVVESTQKMPQDTLKTQTKSLNSSVDSLSRPSHSDEQILSTVNSIGSNKISLSNNGNSALKSHQDLPNQVFIGNSSPDSISSAFKDNDNDMSLNPKVSITPTDSDDRQTTNFSLIENARIAANVEQFLMSPEQENNESFSRFNLGQPDIRDGDVISIKSTHSNFAQVISGDHDVLDAQGAAKYAKPVGKEFDNFTSDRFSPILPLHMVPIVNKEMERRDSTMTHASQTSTKADSLNSKNEFSSLNLGSFVYNDPRRDSTFTNASTVVGASTKRESTVNPKIITEEIIVNETVYVDEFGNEIDPTEIDLDNMVVETVTVEQKHNAKISEDEDEGNQIFVDAQS